ncbi:MAG: helix-turn-helix transcriptional regulator [Ilumatobacteraceae bacterium]|jgi:DNA-binding XRE family transcriptional regulator
MRKPPTERQLRLAASTTAEVLAGQLAEMRHARDWSQDDLARRAGVDRKTVNRIEKGHFSPSLDTLVRLSVALGCRLSDLVGK